MTSASSLEKQLIHAMSILTLAPANIAEAYAIVSKLTDEQRNQFVSLADSNHVVIRALEPLSEYAASLGNQPLVLWADVTVARERERISNAVQHLQLITTELENAGCPVTVMKSLDHWPDLGNDLDLYTTASAERVAQVMRTRFKANTEPRSWGDRLANKWNFAVPGLPESVEVHAQRLGQTGEHTLLAHRFVARRVVQTALNMNFFVPAPEERIIVATLQRMYRHFYFRVCDIVNTARLVESGAVDFAELQRAAEIGGIWKGVCSYLKIVSDYVEKYRGTPVALPQQVLATAPFGGEKVYVRAKFLRVPILPNGAELYTSQVTNTAKRGDVEGTLRLSLLPYLASIAAVSYKLTGSDKGIW